MRWVSKCIPKQMRLQPLPENVGTERRVSEVVRQRVPRHRTSDGERPTAERAATMSWYDEMVAAGRSNDGSMDKVHIKPRSRFFDLQLPSGN